MGPFAVIREAGVRIKTLRNLVTVAAVGVVLAACSSSVDRPMTAAPSTIAKAPAPMAVPEAPRQAARPPAIANPAPRTLTGYQSVGVASWYGGKFHGRKTANGEIYDQNALTAAHRELPFGTRLEVTNLANGLSVVVTVNDRGPFVDGRIIDLSRRAAADLDFVEAGLANVRIQAIGSAMNAEQAIQSATLDPNVLSARIVDTSEPMQCVPYARAASGIGIRGDAQTWWERAEQRYRRGCDPERGAVMVLARTSRIGHGHLAVVQHIVNEREIIVDHANWLNEGRIHLSTPVRDISPDNDWSAVRVWYTPGNSYGSRNYLVQGFVYPDLAVASDAN